MPINKETILSVYDDKLTLVQWLKKVEDALKNDTLKNVELLQDGNKVAFKFVFEKSEITTDYLELQANGIEAINYDSRSQQIAITFTDGTVRILGPLFDANSDVTLRDLEAVSVTTKTVNADNINVDGDINSNGSISASDEIQSDDIVARNTLSSMERILDHKGNFRFVEGDITIDDTNIIQSYGKWSLSGSHLLIVVAGSIASGISVSGRICNIHLPKWVVDKISLLYNVFVDSKITQVFNDDFSTQNLSYYLEKRVNDTYPIQIHLGSFTASKDRNFRLTFDLLIDTD